MMPRIKKKMVRNQTYYSLEHAIRRDGTIQKKEKYLGRRIPENIETLKKEFLSELLLEEWQPFLEDIQRTHLQERKKTPKSGKEKELETFVTRFTYDTQRIEGSTLTLRETADLLERGITPNSRPVVDVKEAEAHSRIFHKMLEYEKDLSLQVVLYWHRELFVSSKPDIAGKIRQHQVAISGSKFMPAFPAEIYPLLREFFKWYNRSKSKLHPVELAALVHLKFVTVHPFTDGNGRISRLMMNFVLNKYDYPMFNIRYEKRAGYYNALERAQVTGDEHIFQRWLYRRYVKEYGRYLDSGR